eukprot:m.223851 g.223851  ORF g.223851 m.223851 type:complete len:107 (-) comp17274_c0_seq5:128-448(-)
MMVNSSWRDRGEPDALVEHTAKYRSSFRVTGCNSYASVIWRPLCVQRESGVIHDGTSKKLNDAVKNRAILKSNAARNCHYMDNRVNDVYHRAASRIEPRFQANQTS